MTPADDRATPRKSEEAQGQMALFQLLRLLEPRWPLLRYAACIPNGEKRDKATAGRLKAMGVKKGLHDIVVFCANRCSVAERGPYYFIGLTIEAKTATGRLSPDQQRWSSHLSSEGWYCYEYYGDWRPAAALVINWCGGDSRTVEGL